MTDLASEMTTRPVQIGPLMRDLGEEPAAVPGDAVCRPASTLILGLGNPILGDDGAGWRVAEMFRSAIGSCYTPRDLALELDCFSGGGLALMERILGCQRVILIDAMQTGAADIGEVRVCRLEDLANPGAGHSSSAHDATLLTALELARAVGAAIPARIDVVGIEISRAVNFADTVTESVSRALPRAVEAVLDLLEEEAR